MVSSLTLLIIAPSYCYCHVIPSQEKEKPRKSTVTCAHVVTFVLCNINNCPGPLAYQGLLYASLMAIITVYYCYVQHLKQPQWIKN